MPFGTITAQTLTYDPRSPGTYTRTTVGFGQPDNSFIVRGASVNNGVYRASVSKILQKDVTVNGSTVRRTSTFTSSWVTTADFTAAEIDSQASDVAEFLTSTTITRINQGES